MNSRVKFLFLCICLFAVALSATTAEARRPQKFRLGFAISTNHHIGMGYIKFAELVEEKSKGSMRVEIFGNAVLGNDRTLGEAVQSGTLTFVSLPTPALAGFHKDFMALDLPYITTPAYTKQFLSALDEGALSDYFRKIANSIGLEPLLHSEYGFRNFQTVKKPINKIEDLKGLKIRTTDSPIEVGVAKALGMIPSPIAWGEVYTALSQGVVEAVGNTAAMSHEAKHSELIKHTIDSAHNYSMHHLFANKSQWDALTDEQRKIVREAAKEASAYQRGLASKKEQDTIDLWKKNGVTFVTLTPEQKKQLFDLTQPVRDEFTKDLPKEFIELIQATQK